MNSYEKLLQKASDEDVTVYESFDLNGDSDPAEPLNGLYIDGNIALDKSLSTTAEKSCILAEELGHHFTTHGNILNGTDACNRKQEYRARLWGYDLQIGLIGIIRSYEHGCCTLFEIADFLNVTENYLSEALECYRKKFGIYTVLDNYMIYFEPSLAICKFYD